MNNWTDFEKWMVNKLSDIESGISDLRVDVGKLKVKAGVWGLFGGSIPVIISALVYYLR